MSNRLIDVHPSFAKPWKRSPTDSEVAFVLAYEAGRFWYWGKKAPNWPDDCNAELWAKEITGMFYPRLCSLTGS